MVKILMVGSCPRCHAEFIRPFPCDAAACLCKNPDAVLVPLHPVLELPDALYRKFAKISELSGVEVNTLINKLLAEAAKSLWQKAMATCP